MSGKAPERYTMVPMEGTVEALMDYLVAPLLPTRASLQATAEEQQSVAKQMHAVVLLYNYYHRRQFPELEFLDFRSFCEATTIAKPVIFGFMKFMHKNGENPQDMDSEISVPEKKIMDACNISLDLDASKNAPNMEGWPVSWVAVFLVDDKKEKCYLEFGSSTLGIWSLLEKEVDEPTSNLVNNISIKKCAFEGKTSHECPDEALKDDSARQIAFSLVEQKTGICCSKLLILERNVTYSLNKEKTSTILYIMKSVEAVTGLVEFAIEDVISRLAGPLIHTGLTPEVTSVVEYYHLLPYVNILSDWLSRVAPRDASLDLQRHLPDSHDSGINECDVVEQTLVISSNNMNKSANEFEGKNGSYLSFSQDSSREISIPQANAVTFSAELDLLSKSKDGITYHNNNNTNETSKSRNEPLLAIFETDKLGNDSSSNQFQQPSSGEDDVQKNAIFSNTYVNKRASSHMEDAANLAKKPREINGGEVFGRDASQNFQNAELPVPLASEKYDEFSFMMASKKHELLQASLRILQKRRDDLVQQRRYLDDEIAEYEMNIKEILIGQATMILNVESMIRACNALCSSQMQLHSSYSGFGNQVQEIKVKGLSEAILISKNSCQELDDVCRENGWTLPIYSLFPSTAGRSYQARVTVVGIDFESMQHGDLKSRPDEARLSAATVMLSRLRSMVVDQHQTLG